MLGGGVEAFSFWRIFWGGGGKGHHVLLGEVLRMGWVVGWGVDCLGGWVLPWVVAPG